MEIPSQEAEMPIPLNSTYGGGHAHHTHHAHAHHMMQHHHHHQHQHNQNHHDPPPPPPPPSSSSILGQQINVPSSGPNAPMTSSPPDHDEDEEEDDEDDVHDHGNNNNSSNHHVSAVVPFQKPVKYRECLKNHAASMGGNATDGCGEFMPSGDDGTLEALTCSACSCHRNFHRKETSTDGGGGPTTDNSRMGRKVYLGHRYLGQDNNHNSNSIVGYHRPHHYGPGPLGPHHHHPMIMSYNMPSESDEMEGNNNNNNNNNNGGGTVRPSSLASVQKKRFRTKFSQEQKEKMLSFAEKVGWKIQKQEEGVVQQFCQEVGVKRRVLKVWMHNNKHNLAKKQQQLQLQQHQQQQQPLHHQHHPNNNNSDLNQV